MIMPLLAALLIVGSADKPDALKRAEEARSAAILATSRIEYSVRHRSKDGWTERFYSFRAADGDVALTHLGDEDRVVARRPDSTRLPAQLDRPMQLLLREGELWWHIEDNIRANIFEPAQATAFRVYDARRLGLDPAVFAGDFEQRIRAVAPDAQVNYETVVRDGLHVVTARTGADAAFRWYLDPTRDWNPVKTEVIQDGEVINERRFQLQLLPEAGVWFPERIEQFAPAAGHKEPTQTIQVSYASFNQPEHPERLTPESIGVQVGTQVIDQTGRGRPVGYWDGTQSVSRSELHERIAQGELSLGPAVARERQRLRAFTQRRREAGLGPFDTPAAADEPQTQPERATPGAVDESLWEAHTRAFIERYQLDDEQAQKAWALCRECEHRAAAYRASRQARFDEVAEALEHLARQEKVSPEARQRVEQQRDALLAPIRRIFEERLKPGLERLPTRAQRVAVDGPSKADEATPSGEEAP